VGSGNLWGNLSGLDGHVGIWAYEWYSLGQCGHPSDHCHCHGGKINGPVILPVTIPYYHHVCTIASTRMIRIASGFLDFLSCLGYLIISFALIALMTVVENLEDGDILPNALSLNNLSFAAFSLELTDNTVVRHLYSIEKCDLIWKVKTPQQIRSAGCNVNLGQSGGCWQALREE
jgi:hypothetical protein